ncbi:MULTISPECIES: hypothetical protein [unclassified Caballeronia]|uniref:hypothetical protein n=1 Tax=unclassified Caballeronia TaxID=2646786 RepID=UPI00158ADAA5|nr:MULTISPECIES: hypothetical protein [unclassified Caballeronia]QSN63471.1 hypothetical protein JYK05_14670 [Caballeronia sp. M1242]
MEVTAEALQSEEAANVGRLVLGRRVTVDMYNIGPPLKQCDIRAEMFFEITGAEKARYSIVPFQK